MKIQMTIEVTYEDSSNSKLDPEELEWFKNNILIGDGSLLLHSNEMGDLVGEVTDVRNVKFIQ